MSTVSFRPLIVFLGAMTHRIYMSSFLFPGLNPGRLLLLSLPLGILPALPLPHILGMVTLFAGVLTSQMAAIVLPAPLPMFVAASFRARLVVLLILLYTTFPRVVCPNDYLMELTPRLTRIYGLKNLPLIRIKTSCLMAFSMDLNFSLLILLGFRLKWRTIVLLLTRRPDPR